MLLGDSLVKAKRTTPERLIRAAEDSRGYRCRSARRAARYVRAGVDSPMESRLRMLLVLAGLPEPTVNFVLWGATGEWELRFDLYYAEYKLLVEYDGQQHAENSAQWESDIYRREELDRRGLRLIVVTSNGIYRQPLRTLQRVRAALIERGASGLPATFSDEWRRYFG
jgi:very-short-patch-repair endonuclease